jgi:lysophospholipase L1-like esterase
MIPGLYEDVLLRRAIRARRTGSSCVIADSPPIPAPPAMHRRFSAIHRRVAKAAGCTWTPVLETVWGKRSLSAASRAGLLHKDRFHPTAAGYKLMAKALAPVIATAVRARAKHPVRRAPEQVLAPSAA